MKSNIYISRRLLNSHDLIEWAKEQGFETTLEESDFHVTIVYCKNKVDWDIIPHDPREMIFIDREEGERAIHLFDGGACVLEFKSDILVDRYAELGTVGVQSRYPEYRSHITITYNLPKDMDIANIKPYDGYLVFGPEIYKPIDPDWKSDSKETPLTESFVPSITDDQLYDIFAKSYTATTGKTWGREKFLHKARLWTFYGDDTGFVAVRKQGNGMLKLVAIAGDTRGVVSGLKQLTEENEPTWGLVSPKLAVAAKRFGFIQPHTIVGGTFIMRMLMKTIPDSVFGGTKPIINPDGSFTISYDDLGETTKMFVANRAYFDKLRDNPHFQSNLGFGVDGLVKKFFSAIFK
jgi:hypothetical protein